MHKEINILGYSGSHMSLIFESLCKQSYKGLVRVIMHDDTKYFDVPFMTDIHTEVSRFDELKETPGNGFFFCSNMPVNKRFLFNFFHDMWAIREENFISIAHPSSIIASTVRYRGGLYLEPLSVVSPYTDIGFGVSVGRLCSVGHHNRLNDYSSIYPGSHLTGDVNIGKAVTIGPGTTVFSGVTIGDYAVIGGGSVVTKDIPASVMAFGNPCKVIKDLPPPVKQYTIL